MSEKPKLQGSFKEIVDNLNQSTKTLLDAVEQIKKNNEAIKAINEKWRLLNITLKEVNEKMKAANDRFEKAMGEKQKPNKTPAYDILPPKTNFTN